MLPFTESELRQAVEDGRVTARRHPTRHLTIYNYSPEVQYSNRWDEVTLTCRGLILDHRFNIVARPWRKFFNLGQIDLPIQLTDPVEVMDKADGSLGILYPNHNEYDIVYEIATRGSFESDQAKHATRVWREKYSHLDPTPGYTMLFEIIYPANRIVLDYDGMDDLMLLGAVEIETGYYISPSVARWLWHSRELDPDDRHKISVQWPGPVVETMQYKTISDAMLGMDRKNAEGFVIRSHNFLVKMKQPDYLDLHRLVTNMTPKTIWEKLRDGKTVKDICLDLPDEFHGMVKGYAEPILEKFEKRSREIVSDYLAHLLTLGYSHDSQPPRKMFAQFVAKSPDKRYYFALLDGKPVDALLWQEVKPRDTSLADIKDGLDAL